MTMMMMICTCIYVLKAVDQMSSSVEIRGSITRSRLKLNVSQSADQPCFILILPVYLWLLDFLTFTGVSWL